MMNQRAIEDVQQRKGQSKLTEHYWDVDAEKG